MMSQGEIDALLKSVQEGGSLDDTDHKKRIAGNCKQLESALKRAEAWAVANARPEERAERLGQVHYYAHWNWLLKRGFASKAEFRSFVRREMRKRGMGKG